MFFKYCLICFLLQLVLVEGIRDSGCINAVTDEERDAATDLYYGKEKCDDIFGDCYYDSYNPNQRIICNDPYYDCLEDVINAYKVAIKCSEFASGLFREAMRHVSGDCDGLCKYIALYRKVFAQNAYCG